jgi:hypothetical protein
MSAEHLSREGIDAPPGGAMDMGLQLYAALVSAGFSEKTIFSTLACQVACAAHDSTSPLGFIKALSAAAQEIAPVVQTMRQEQAAEWAARQRQGGTQ